MKVMTPREIRLALGMSIYQFMNAMDVCKNTVYRWELPEGHKDRRIPSKPSRRLMEKLLDEKEK